MDRTTVTCLSKFIYLENLYCINRSFLIKGRAGRIIWYCISLTIFFIFIYAVINNYMTGESNMKIKVFEVFLAAEFAILVFAARHRTNSFDAINRLDAKYAVGAKYITTLENEVRKQIVISVVSVFVDIFGMHALGYKPIDIFAFTITLSAREAELILFAMIIKAMNMKLAQCNEAAPSVGSRLYRHIIIAASQINEEYSSMILLLMAVMLITTIAYACAVMLDFTIHGKTLMMYLLWRELKSLYSLWKVCVSSWESDKICQDILLRLVKKLVFDPAFDKAKNPQAFAIVNRWCKVVRHHRPSCARGSIIAVGLSVPLNLLDNSVNYFLIIIQIYLAYTSNSAY